MEIAFFLVASIVGLATVLQAGINKSVGSAIDLNLAVLINASVVLVISGSFYIFARFFPQSVDGIFVPQSVEGSKLSSMTWKILLSGICGFSIVMGIPWAMSKIGALKVILVMIVSQIVFSSLWDYFIEGTAITTKRVVGALIAVLGAAIAVL